MTKPTAKTATPHRNLRALDTADLAVVRGAGDAFRLLATVAHTQAENANETTTSGTKTSSTTKQ